MIIFVYGEQFAVQVADEQIHPAILVKVGGIDAHAGTRFAVRTVGDPGGCGDLIELSVPSIDEQEIGDGIVRYPKVHQPVIIYVCGDDSPSLAQVASDTGISAHVSKSSVAVVVEEPTGFRRINFGDAVVAAAVLVDTAGFVQFLAELHEVADEQVQTTVIVVVKPHRASSPTRSAQASLRSNVRKRPVTVVVVVQESAAGTRGFREVLFEGFPVGVSPADAASFGGNLFERMAVCVSKARIAPTGK